MLTTNFLIKWYVLMLSRMKSGTNLTETGFVTPFVTNTIPDADFYTWVFESETQHIACLSDKTTPLAAIMIQDNVTWGSINHTWVERPRMSFNPPSIQLSQDYTIQKVLAGDAVAYIHTSPVEMSKICAGVEFFYNGTFVSLNLPFDYRSLMTKSGIYASTTMSYNYFRLYTVYNMPITQCLIVILVSIIYWTSKYQDQRQNENQDENQLQNENQDENQDEDQLEDQDEFTKRLCAIILFLLGLTGAPNYTFETHLFVSVVCFFLVKKNKVQDIKVLYVCSASVLQQIISRHIKYLPAVLPVAILIVIGSRKYIRFALLALLGMIFYEILETIDIVLFLICLCLQSMTLIYQMKLFEQYKSVSAIEMLFVWSTMNAMLYSLLGKYENDNLWESALACVIPWFVLYILKYKGLEYLSIVISCRYVPLFLFIQDNGFQYQQVDDTDSLDEYDLESDEEMHSETGERSIYIETLI